MCFTQETALGGAELNSYSELKSKLPPGKEAGTAEATVKSVSPLLPLHAVSKHQQTFPSTSVLVHDHTPSAL